MSSRQGIVHWIILLAMTGAIIAGLVLSVTTPDWFGAGRYGTHPVPLGDAMPPMCEALPQDTPAPAPSAEGQAVVEHWAARTLPKWPHQAKVTAPRILLAKLASNQDVKQVNQYLRHAYPNSGVGSNWTLHKGDYDFTLVTLTTILYLFGHKSDLLYPETRAHLLDNLLTEDGGTPLVYVPRTRGLVLDTENHHLMTEGSRYLKNQWLRQYGTEGQRAEACYNNRANGLEQWLVDYLREMLEEGLYEFNSRPYMGFTIQALLNLEAFPESPDIRHLARYLLDIVNMQYALGSMHLRLNPPFRRNIRYASITELNRDPHTAYMRIWTGKTVDAANSPSRLGYRTQFALLAELLPYRPPEDVIAWTLHKQEEYFVAYGRGASACPELYSGGPGFLLSAGGATRGIRSLIVARPITLLLKDNATDLFDCFHILGKGDWQQWNNTGVYDRFACANGPVYIPEHLEADAQMGDWRVFQAPDAPDLHIATYSEDTFGLIALFPDDPYTVKQRLDALMADNSDTSMLRSRFVWPDSSYLEYDVEAPAGQWVMKNDSGNILNRDYDSWPQLGGSPPSLSFER